MISGEDVARLARTGPTMTLLSPQDMTEERLPEWALWSPSIPPYSVGLEEELMLLDPSDFSLAQAGERVLAALPAQVAPQFAAETHEAAVELATSPHASAGASSREAAALREALREVTEREGLRAAAAGTHPSALWSDVKVSGGARYQLVQESMRALARREPTFALHVHVGVGDPDSAITLMNRMRAHIPLLLAVSANSPFWQGRDTGLASARTSIFGAFPRVGIPRAFSSYAEYVAVVDQMLRCDAFPEPTFLWWDVRPQPRLGTVEVRIMDVQSTAACSGALAGLVQAIAHLELEEGYHSDELLHAGEILDENRFLAARDGMDARLIDPVAECRLPATAQLRRLLERVRPHAQQLGCEDGLAHVAEIAADTGAEVQRRLAGRSGLRGLVELLADGLAAGR